MYYKMPKNLVDYSNTIIYKIYCKDETVKDVYVGHTTNFTKRKYVHKFCSNSQKNKHYYNNKIYNTIREHGGWNNWEMVEIAKYNCKDSTEARIKEQYHYEELKASLNSCPPYVNKASYFCDKCFINFNNIDDYQIHLNTDTHIQNILGKKNIMDPPKNKSIYECECCNYVTFKKNEYNQHLKTVEHKNNETTTKQQQNDNGMTTKKQRPTNTGSQESSKKLKCENCDKFYCDRISLWRHKKICKNNEKHSENIDYLKSMDKDELIIMLLKQNAKIMSNQMTIMNNATSDIKDIVLGQQNTIVEITKNGLMNQSQNTISSHNKTFNLQFFLNETCKDAMNIMDFVDSIKLQLSDLENVGEVGYVEGISTIISNNLKQLDVTQRPVHCTDKKRETLYIKDEDKWEKEEESNPKMRKVIKHVSHKNAKLIQDFRAKYPDCGTSSSRKSDQFNKMILESMGGSGNNDKEKEDKIIRNILDDICVDKNKYKNCNTIEKIE
jgi:hypothetical protein